MIAPEKLDEILEHCKFSGSCTCEQDDARYDCYDAWALAKEVKRLRAALEGVDEIEDLVLQKARKLGW